MFSSFFSDYFISVNVALSLFVCRFIILNRLTFNFKTLNKCNVSHFADGAHAIQQMQIVQLTTR